MATGLMAAKRVPRPIERSSRPALWAMTQIYHGILRKIASRPTRVLEERVSLSMLAKLRIAWQAMRMK